MQGLTIRRWDFRLCLWFILLQKVIWPSVNEPASAYTPTSFWIIHRNLELEETVEMIF